MVPVIPNDALLKPLRVDFLAFRGRSYATLLMPPSSQVPPRQVAACAFLSTNRKQGYRGCSHVEQLGIRVSPMLEAKTTI